MIWRLRFCFTWAASFARPSGHDPILTSFACYLLPGSLLRRSNFLVSLCLNSSCQLPFLRGLMRDDCSLPTLCRFPETFLSLGASNSTCPSVLQSRYTRHTALWPPHFPKLPTTCGAGAPNSTYVPSEPLPSIVGRCKNFNQTRCTGATALGFAHQRGYEDPVLILTSIGAKTNDTSFFQ